MPSNSETILTQRVHPGDSQVETVTGEKFKGDGYYGRSDGLHTVQFNLEGFTGTVAIEGTLELEPESDDWFSVDLTSKVSVAGSVDTTGAISSSNTSTVSSVAYSNSSTNSNYNFTGNFIWVRAKISNWTDGTVNSVLLNH